MLILSAWTICCACTVVGVQNAEVSQCTIHYEFVFWRKVFISQQSLRVCVYCRLSHCVNTHTRTNKYTKRKETEKLQHWFCSTPTPPPVISKPGVICFTVTLVNYPSSSIQSYRYYAKQPWVDHLLNIPTPCPT